MGRTAKRYQTEREKYLQLQAYYGSIRRPGIEWTTFGIVLAAAIARAGFDLGWWLDGCGGWVTGSYVVALIAFIGLDSVGATADHPVAAPGPFGGLNPGRIFEKFAMQGRLWQPAVILMLPVTARLVAVFRHLGY